MAMADSNQKTGRATLVAALFAGTAATLAQPAAAQSTLAKVTDATSSVQEVVVTAAKRRQPLQDVPIAVTALTGDVITKMGGSDLADIAGAIPGLSFENDRAGENRTYIRGISEVAGTAPSVGVYIDEIPVTTFSGEQVNLKTFDLDRIEVLRGPQGTLYGEGSEGGTIRVITNKPDSHQYEGAIFALGSTTDHGGSNGELDAMINVPLVRDTLALRIVGLASDYDGWIDNPVIGKDHYNRNKDFTTRADLRFTPDDKTTIDLNYTHQYAKSDGPSDGDGDYKDYAGTAEPRNDRFDIYSLTASRNLGFATLTSATGYFVRNSLSHNDFTSTAPILGLLFGTPVNTADILRPNDQKAYTEELRLVSNGSGPLAWTVGGFFKHDTIDISNATETSPALPVTVFSLDVNDRSTQYAVFAEGDYAITSQWHFVAGLRYFDEERKTDSAVSGLLPLVLSGTNFSGLNQKVSNSEVTPKLSLNYKLNRDVLIYATASSGFRAGDINPYAFLFPGAPNSFGPERLWNYEVGAKTSWFDRRLTANGAVYHIDWQDVIINAAAPSALFGYSVNGGSAHSDGVELELNAVPVTGLTLTFSGNYNISKIDKVSTAGAGVLATSGATLPFAPKYKLYAAAEYDFPLAGSSWMGRVRADVSYNGSNFSDISDQPATLNKAYTVVNLRAGASHDDWDIAVFASNLGNVRGELVSLNNGTNESTLIRPRTIGVSIGKKF